MTAASMAAIEYAVWKHWAEPTSGHMGEVRQVVRDALKAAADGELPGDLDQDGPPDDAEQWLPLAEEPVALSGDPGEVLAAAEQFAAHRGWKRCTRCGPRTGLLPPEAFGMDRQTRDGRRERCRECVAEVRRELKEARRGTAEAEAA